MTNKTALLTGGSGLIGRHCLHYLLNDERYSKVVILVRQRLSIEHPKLIQYQINFDTLKEELPKIQADDVYCCLGTTVKKAKSKAAFRTVDFAYPVEIAKHYLANGAHQFLLVTALGANLNSSIFYNQVKGDVEKTISKLDYKSIYIFRPSLLVGNRLHWRLGEKIVQKISQWFFFGFIGALKKYKPIEAKAVAFAMLQSAKAQYEGIQIIESNQIQTIYDKQ